VTYRIEFWLASPGDTYLNMESLSLYWSGQRIYFQGGGFGQDYTHYSFDVAATAPAPS